MKDVKFQEIGRKDLRIFGIIIFSKRISSEEEITGSYIIRYRLLSIPIASKTIKEKSVSVVREYL